MLETKQRTEPRCPRGATTYRELLTWLDSQRYENDSIQAVIVAQDNRK